MKNHEMPNEFLPYIAEALEEQGVSQYEIQRTATHGIVRADVSNRLIKKCKRRAWATRRSRQIQLNVLTREDVKSKRNGVIPETEIYHFMKARL